MCKCLPAKCDCNPLADDPDSFCAGDDVCKVRSWTEIRNNVFTVYVYSSGLRVSAPVPAGVCL